MTEEAKRPQRPAAKSLRILDDSVLDGFSLDDIKCRSCSGYGNCGYKSNYLNPAGGIASVCMRYRKQLQCERDGVEFNLDDLAV